MAYSPTPRQADLLRYVAGFQQAKGYSPSFLEIADAVYSGKKGGAHRAAEALAERGLIRWMRGKARSIELLCPVPIPYSPEGEPLRFIAVGGPL